LLTDKIAQFFISEKVKKEKEKEKVKKEKERVKKAKGKGLCNGKGLSPKG